MSDSPSRIEQPIMDDHRPTDDRSQSPVPKVSRTVYLDGAFIERPAATIDAEDRGILFGDGVYEVLRYYAGVPLALDLHMQRLDRSLREIELGAAVALAARLPEVSDELLARNGLSDAKVYWQITRGSAERNHVFIDEHETGPTRPTVLAMAYSAGPVDTAAPPRVGKAVTAPDERWHRCDIKSLMLLPNCLAKTRAVRAGADEAILHRGGIVTEGTSMSLFIVDDGVLMTHPADNWILPGITRHLVLDCAREAGLPVCEQVFTVDTLLDADEVFLTGTTTHLTAVGEVDGQAIGAGSAGPITQQLHEAFMAMLSREALAKACT